jgi:hypothetical protein
MGIKNRQPTVRYRLEVSKIVLEAKVHNILYLLKRRRRRRRIWLL